MKKRLPLLAACVALLFGGCVALSSPFHRAPPRPGRTTLGAPLVVVPAQTLGNLLVVEVRLDRAGPYRFLVDTGSSVTHISPELAKRHAAKDAPPPDTPHVRVRSASGDVTELPATTLNRLDLGEARFDEVPALIYDCAPLTAHLGVKIDGVLGFPLFREALLTLDYPNSRLLLQPLNTSALIPGTMVPLDDSDKVPLIHVRLGDRTLLALIDSGSDAPLSLNPVGLDPHFVTGPRPGSTVGTLTGDTVEQVGRLSETLTLGDYALSHPLVSLTDELTSVGGDVLKYFSVTFDQLNDRVIFHRPAHDPVTPPPRRSVGLSFTRTTPYWRVVGVVQHSPAETAGVETGDLVTKINGEAVAKWDLPRYQNLTSTARQVTFTFWKAGQEIDLKVDIFDLIP